MRILVTGANGQLGMSLRRVLPQGTVYTDITSGSDTVPLDITDENDIRSKVEQYDIDTIVNCAAYTNVEAAEDNFMQAEFLNSFAVGNLARVMKERNGLLVHISTDYVFGGETYNTPCDENRKGTPTGVYGRTKLRGELSILESGVRHIIIRTAWLYSEFGKNFVKTMMKLTATLPQVQVVYDQVGSPTYAGDLAEATLRIVLCVGYTTIRMMGCAPGMTLPSSLLYIPGIRGVTSDLALVPSFPQR